MQGLDVSTSDGVTIITFARPAARNALTCQMLRTVAEELRRSRGPVVLTGGPQAFSAGVDVAEIGRGDLDLDVDDDIAGVTRAIAAHPSPVIAAIEGPCFGAAVDIAVSCDARVAGDGSYFGIPATRLGILYRPEAVAALVATVGKDTATRLLVLGERIDSREAVRSGIATHDAPKGGAEDTARAIAQASMSAVSDAVAATKRLIAATASTHTDLSDFERIRRELLASPERAIAVAALQQRLVQHSAEQTSGDSR